MAHRNRAVDGLEGILGQHAVVAQTFDFEEPVDCGLADLGIRFSSTWLITLL
jgi:hypothetical protein